MDRRVAILRFWLLCFVATTAAIYWPALGIALWPVAFLFPSCACCGECGGGCQGVAPFDFQVVFAGFSGLCTDSTCNAAYNLTVGFTLGAGGSGFCGAFGFKYSNSCAGLAASWTPVKCNVIDLTTPCLEIGKDGTKVGCRISLGDFVTVPTHRFDSSDLGIGDAAADCTTISGVSVPYTFNSGGPCSTGSPTATLSSI